MCAEKTPRDGARAGSTSKDGATVNVHDLNNALGVILGHATIARNLVSDVHPAAESLDSVIEAARHAAKLLKREPA